MNEWQDLEDRLKANDRMIYLTVGLTFVYSIIFFVSLAVVLDGLGLLD